MKPKMRKKRSNINEIYAAKQVLLLPFDLRAAISFSFSLVTI